MLISHEIQGFFNLLDGARPLAAEAAAGLSTVEVVRTFLKGETHYVDCIPELNPKRPAQAKAGKRWSFC